PFLRGRRGTSRRSGDTGSETPGRAESCSRPCGPPTSIPPPSGCSGTCGGGSPASVSGPSTATCDCWCARAYSSSGPTPAAAASTATCLSTTISPVWSAAGCSTFASRSGEPCTCACRRGLGSKCCAIASSSTVAVRPAVHHGRGGEHGRQGPEGKQEPHEPEGSLRGGVAGEPALPVLRAGRRHRGLPGHGGAVQGHRGRGDGARLRPPRFPQGSRGPGDERAVREDGEQPPVGGRGRDLRVHPDVPGHGQDGPRRGLPRAGRVVRDAREGREVPRRPVHEGPEAGRREGAGRGDLAAVTLDVRAAEFWEPAKVEAELRRVYDICAGCRRCVGLCPSFKVMFDRIDTPVVDGDVEKLPAAHLAEVVDLCYQCKLCYNHCPYTPPHRWQVDFPRLMLRARAAEARRRGVSLQDRMLGATELVGRLGALTAPLSNWANELAVHRAFMQAVAGIHRDRMLPKFHRETFGKWFARRRRAPG